MTDFRQALEDGDVGTLRALWRHHYPHLTQPKDDAEGAIVLHRARTEAKAVSLAKRLYSHDWLTERGLPSGLPDDMRPRIVDAVGVSVRSTSSDPARIERAAALEKVMADAAAEAMLEGIEDVTGHMWAAANAFKRGYA